MIYILQGKIEYEVEAESKEEAVKKGEEKFAEIEKLDVKISEGKVADKNTGYFL